MVHSCGRQRTRAQAGVLEQQAGKGIAAGDLFSYVYCLAKSYFCSNDNCVFFGSEESRPRGAPERALVPELYYST